MERIQERIVYESDIEKLIANLKKIAERLPLDVGVNIELEPRVLSEYTRLASDYDVEVIVQKRTVFTKFSQLESIDNVIIRIKFFIRDIHDNKAVEKLKELIKDVYVMGKGGIIDVSITIDPTVFRMKGGAETTAPLNPFLP